MVYVTKWVSAITDTPACKSEIWVNNYEGSSLTKCRQQKEKRTDHDPPALWKEDPGPPYNHNIIENQLGMAGGHISDECNMGN